MAKNRQETALFCFWWDHKWYKGRTHQAVNMISLPDGTILSVGKWTNEYPDAPLDLSVDQKATQRFAQFKRRQLWDRFHIVVAEEVK